ncbi:MAG: cytochrome c [Deltaproteobacteria bacterium]|nr:cytochrome c [Deltaproteobacteria bacterium]
MPLILKIPVLLKYFRLIKPALIIVCSLSLATACTPSKPKETLPRLSNMGPASLHKVQSKRLELLMHEMEHLVFERLYSELERDRIRLRNAKQIATLLTEMASTIKNPDYIKNNLNLDEKNQLYFEKLAADLDRRARIVKEAIRSEDPASLRMVTGKMINACNACHDQFRDMSKESKELKDLI